MAKTKTKALAVALALLMMFALAACAREADEKLETETSPAQTTATTQETTQNTTTAQASASNALEAYNAVLKNDTDMYDTEVGKHATFKQFIERSSDIQLFVSRFAVIDLDGEGIPEVVLWTCKMNDHDNNVGFTILHYQDGTVYSYSLSYRQFNDLKADGTFQSSGSAGSYGICTIAFNKSEYTIDEFTYREGTTFYVNHTSATEQEFSAAFDSFLAKQGVRWYEFSDANVESLLGGNASAGSGTSTNAPPPVQTSDAPHSAPAATSRSLTDAELAELNAAFNYPYANPELAPFLTCLYNSPQEIDPNEVFYNGAGGFIIATDEQKDYLAANGYNMPADWRDYVLASGVLEDLGAVLLESSKVNEILQRRLGLSLSQVQNSFKLRDQGYSLEYVDEYNAYFARRTDSNKGPVNFISGQYADSGVYTADYQVSSWIGDLTEGTYRVTYRLLGNDINSILFISNVHL